MQPVSVGTGVPVLGGTMMTSSILSRIERAMREGQLPDPRRNPWPYGLFGLLLGYLIAS